MNLISNRVQRSDIIEGDHIYSWRTLFIYSHHGIYIGNGLVIHFTAPPEKLAALTPPSLASSSSAPGGGQQRTCPNHPHCGSQKHASGVAITCLDCFIEKGSLYRYEYGVTFGLKHLGGTCTAEQSDPASTVLRRANYLLENGFGNYNLVRNNCEDFALYCKTGILVTVDQGVGNSGQIASVLHALFPLTSTVFYLARNNGIKVPVEDMDKFHRGSF